MRLTDKEVLGAIEVVDYDVAKEIEQELEEEGDSSMINELRYYLHQIINNKLK